MRSFKRTPGHRSSPRKTSLPAFELGFFFREKRLDAGLEVLGVEAGVGLVALGRGGRARAGEAPREFLVPARDERRAVGDAPRSRQRLLRDLVVGHDAVDEALVFGFLGPEYAAFEQDLERGGAADERDQPLHLAVADDEAEVLDRYAETARGPADAQVALRDDFEASPDADAVDHRHDRVPASRDRAHRRLEHRAVFLCALRVPARRFALGDVRAGGEGLVACAPNHDAAQALVGVELAHDFPQPLPRAEPERVQLARVAERDGGDVAIALEKDFT